MVSLANAMALVEVLQLSISSRAKEQQSGERRERPVQSCYRSPAPPAQRSTSHPSNPPLSLYTSLHNLLIIIYKNFKIKVND